jgi:hypothetical protein
VVNEGTETESFTLRVYYYGEHECCTGEEVNNLPPGESRTLIFSWNTRARRALPVEGELDTDDNACRSLAAVMVRATPVEGIIVQIESPATLSLTLLTALALTLVLIAIIAAGVIITGRAKSTAHAPHEHT